MKYHLITLGCQMNLSDSERVSSVLESMGYERTEKRGGSQFTWNVGLLGTAKAHRQGLQQNCPVEQMEKQTQCGNVCLRMYFCLLIKRNS